MRRLFTFVILIICAVVSHAADRPLSLTTAHHPSPVPHPVFAGSPIQGLATLDDPAYFANINIVNDDSQQNETGIAVNPRNPKQLVAVANDFGCNSHGQFSTMPYNYSSDGGKTWVKSCLPLPNGLPYNNPFDPTVAYDSRGNVYVCYGENRSAGDDHQNGIYINKSTDGGATFQTAVQVVANLRNEKSGSGGTQAFEDKYYVCCDANVTSPNRDNVYISWSHSAPGQAFVIEAVHSVDGGQTWSGPVGVSRGGNPQGSVPSCGPNGEVYVAWSNSSPNNNFQLLIARSEDAGQTFSNPVPMAHVIGIGTENSTNHRYELVSKGNMRISTFPSMCVDNSSGPHKGTIYSVWQALDGAKEAHIFISTSTNKGQTWSTPRVLDQANSGLDVYMPAIVCDPVTGDVCVDYFDSRYSPDNSGFDLYYSVSKNGGLTFAEYRITDRTTKVYTESQGGTGGSYFGDYQGITAYGGTAWPCWWDCRTGPGYGYCHIYTAQIRNSARPVSGLIVSSSCAAPASATLTWTDPTQTTISQPLPDFTVAIFRNDTQVGTVPKGTQIFTDNGLTAGTRYVYSVVVNGGPGPSEEITAAITAGGGGPPNAPVAVRLRPAAGGIEVRWTNPSTHTDGTTACDLQSIYFYNDTNTTPLDSIILAANSAGKPGVKVLTLDSTKIWKIYLRARTSSAGTVAASDSTAHFLSFAGAPRATFNYKFDSPSDTPIMYATGSWGLTNKKAKSAPNSLTDSPSGSSLRNKTTICQLPPFVLKAPDTTLVFQHILLSAASTVAEFDLTTDNGITWTYVRGFNQNQHPDLWKSTVDSSSWFEEHRSLLSSKTATFAHVGDTVSIRFRISTTFAVLDGWYIDDLTIDNSPTDAVREPGAIPSALSLEQNYPNPFNPSTRIRFSVPNTGDVLLTVTDALGRRVATLINGKLENGVYSTEFNADQLPSGTYFSMLRADGRYVIKQMMFLK